MKNDVAGTDSMNECRGTTVMIGVIGHKHVYQNA